MFSGTNNLSRYNHRNLIIWMTLAFQGGSINAGGFIACHRFVTHTTGFATFFGAEFAKGNWTGALGMLTVPLFFIAGAMISGFFVDRRMSLNKAPKYNLMIGLVAFFMILVVLLGRTQSFGQFGEVYSNFQNYSLLAILCLASGIQNACITSASGAVIRTTHLTGLTTDLGIGLVRVLAWGQPKTVRFKEFQANIARISIIAFFILGSTVSAFAYYKFEYWGFIIPATTAIGIIFFGSKSKSQVVTT